MTNPVSDNATASEQKLWLREFTTTSRWWDGLWGSGHTLATDPTRQGWRAALSRKGGLALIIGQAGVPGCASVMQLGGQLHVALYCDVTPEQVARAFRGELDADARAEVYGAAMYRTIPVQYPGWGLEVIQMILVDRRG